MGAGMGLSVFSGGGISPSSSCAALWDLQPLSIQARSACLQLPAATLSATGSGQGKIHLL